MGEERRHSSGHSFFCLLRSRTAKTPISIGLDCPRSVFSSRPVRSSLSTATGQFVPNKKLPISIRRPLISPPGLRPRFQALLLRVRCFDLRGVFDAHTSSIALMSFIQRITKRLPSAPSLPIDDGPREKGRNPSRFAFFRRRIRLKGNSSISIPLGFVLLFPCLVIVFILLLFVRHPSSPGGILIPAGTPPSIRFVWSFLFSSRWWREEKHELLTMDCLCLQKN